MTTNIFIEACRFIARVAGTKQESGYIPEVSCAGQVVLGQQYAYHDDKMVIFAAMEDLSLEVVIRQDVTPNGDLNPAIMVSANGHAFRTHGEARYLYEHVQNLAVRLVSETAQQGGLE